MKPIIILSIVIGLFGIAQQGGYGQSSDDNKANARSGCSVPTAETLKSRGQLTEDQEIRYRTPIRYVIVYNELGPVDDRRMEVFMNVVNINEKDLRTVFCWIAEAYPSPAALTVNVHTNLATIETPEERELLQDGDGSRFSKYVWTYKEANYHRFDDGLEAFHYTTSLSPHRERKVVIRRAR